MQKKKKKKEALMQYIKLKKILSPVLFIREI